MWLDHKKSQAELRPSRAVWTCANLLTPMLQESTQQRTSQCQVEQRTRSVSWEGAKVAWLMECSVKWTAAGRALVSEADRELVAGLVLQSS